MDLLDIAIAKQLSGGGGGSGTDNYNDLSNLPKINDTTLSGNKSSSALGLQSEINSESKLASDLVDDTDQDNKFVTSTEKNTWNGKQNAIDADHKLSSDLVDDANKTNKFVTSTEKNTWNAKQNAIDSDHKLSSSLVSFTTAEAAALASGIDSSKVGQISTNQTNILYGLQTGVKNILSITSVEFTSDGSALIIPISPVSGKVVVYFENLSSTDTDTSVCKVGLDDAQNHTIVSTTVNRGSNISVTLNTSTSVARYLYMYPSDNGGTHSNGDTLTFTNAMVCTEDAWNQEPNVYRPFSLPNYDLTRLEAEDRAGLVDVVDGGAKNKWDFANPDSTRSTDITKNSNGSFTISCTNAVWTQYFKTFTVDIGKSYALSFNVNSMTNAYSFLVIGRATNSSGTEYFSFTPSLGENRRAFTATSSTIWIAVYLNNSETARSVTATIEPMICTKAAFGVSSKFVPYRPNWDLVGTQLNECGGTYVTMEVKLTELNWLPSSSGKFYCDPFTVAGIKKILSVTFTDFGYLNANDNIAPLLTPNVGSALRFMSNVNTFNTGAFVKVIIHGTI